MNKYEAFINWVRKQEVEDFPPEFEEVLEELQVLAEQPAKPELTEVGAQLLEYLQTQGDVRLKTKDISEGMGISSRKIAGAMRKLTTDGFVSKHGQNPVIYSLTDKGKEFNLQEYKEKLKGENN